MSEAIRSVTPAPVRALASRPTLGVMLMILVTLSTTLQDTLAKALVADYPLMTVAWARYAFAFLIVCAVGTVRAGPGRVFATSHPRTQVIRGVIVLASTVFSWAALRHLPLVDNASIGFAAPMFVTLLAIPLLGEVVGWRRWMAVVVGLAGVLIVLRPGLGVVHPAAGFSLCAALCFALYQVLTRRIAADESIWAQQAYTSLFGAVVLTAALPWAGDLPDSAGGWLLFVLLGGVGVVSHGLVVGALACAPASLLSPFLYVQLIWATLAGFLLFGDLPDRWTVLGATIVIGSGLYVFYRETVRSRLKPAQKGSLPRA
ncbi:DMT family transporter [Marinivivus vitaminiproducens]|uniref:DMT family transporter n=1 Tax=Marinivivus vitaminiproducens TaxID=3035935 RepID=UPI0027989E6F|nr:DMT family transporter [Geminicoccaceae bacterium SCSIO 64248]